MRFVGALGDGDPSVRGSKEATPRSVRTRRRARALREALRDGAQVVRRSRKVSLASYESAERRVLNGAPQGAACWIERADGRVLLVAPQSPRWPGLTWETPGGGGRRGESARQTVRREVHEETGGRLRGLRLWKLFDEELISPDGRRLRWLFFQYRARWASGRPAPGSPREIRRVRWFRRLPARMAFREDWIGAAGYVRGPIRASAGSARGSTRKGRGRGLASPRSTRGAASP